MSLTDELLAEVLDRPRDVTPDLEDWTATRGTDRVLVKGTGRVVDVTHGPRDARVVVQPVDRRYPWYDEELARPWLRRLLVAHRPSHRPRCRCMPCRRVPWASLALDHLRRLPPRWFTGDGSEGEWAYVDLRNAYPSLYGALGLAVHYRPDDTLPRLGLGGWWFVGLDELIGVKSCQRAVGGILRATEMNVLDHGRPRVESTLGWSPFLAPDLWGAMMDTLHAVASDAVSHGAVMWDTDGGVLPLASASSLIHKLWETWGLEATVRVSGRGRVWGVKHWRIGPEETRQAGSRRLLAHDHRIAELAPAVVRLLRETRMARL